jgi:hypothetical protein
LCIFLLLQVTVFVTASEEAVQILWFFLQRRVNQRAASGVARENHAQPLFLHLPEAFPAVFLDF